MGFMCSHRSMSVSLLPEERIRKMTPFGRGNWFPKFLRNAGIYLTTRNLMVQFELISGYI